MQLQASQVITGNRRQAQASTGKHLCLDTKSRQHKSQSTRQKASINISSTDLPALLALALGRSAATTRRAAVSAVARRRRRCR